MNRVDKLEKAVRAIYETRNPDRDEWADWLYESHVFAVAREAKKLSAEYGVENDLPIAAAILHDIADAEMSRFDPRHDKRSIEIAREMLADNGFSSEEQKIVENALRNHGCRDGRKPAFIEGKIMATADAVVHISTDYYEHVAEFKRREGTSEADIASWALSKIERDYQWKICFDKIREREKMNYERVKSLFR